jgi:CRISPR/Cas system-associated protein endoribonuclease Cas2
MESIIKEELKEIFKVGMLSKDIDVQKDSAKKFNDYKDNLIKQGVSMTEIAIEVRKIMNEIVKQKSNELIAEAVELAPTQKLFLK